MPESVAVSDPPVSPSKTLTVAEVQEAVRLLSSSVHFVSTETQHEGDLSQERRTLAKLARRLTVEHMLDVPAADRASILQAAFSTISTAPASVEGTWLARLPYARGDNGSLTANVLHALYLTALHVLGLFAGGDESGGRAILQSLLAESDAWWAVPKADPLASKLLGWLLRSSREQCIPLDWLLQVLTVSQVRKLPLTAQVAHNAIMHALLFGLHSYEQAEQFLSATPHVFSPLSHSSVSTSSTEGAKHRFYCAQLAAVHKEYAASEEHLLAAMQAAQSHHSGCGEDDDGREGVGAQTGRLGFLQRCQQLLVTVQLSQGIVPPRPVFERPKVMAVALRPYKRVAQAVHTGDLVQFAAVVEDGKAQFVRDGTFVLVQRLHQNVVRAALKRLQRAYARIALVEVARRLQLPSVQDARYVVLKAIHDGIIHDVSLLDDDKRSDAGDGTGELLVFHRPGGDFGTHGGQSDVHGRLGKLATLLSSLDALQRVPPVKIARGGTIGPEALPFDDGDLDDFVDDGGDFMDDGGDFL